MISNRTLKGAKAGAVTWDELKAELMTLPKETLADAFSVWIQNYWACQNYWITYVERDFGQENAERLDGEVFKKTARIQAKGLVKLFGLGDDMDAMATVLKFISTQWPPAGFNWEIDEVTDEKIRFHVNECPMGTFRKANDLEVFKCKNISTPLYNAMVTAVNPKMKAICTHAHPDEAIDGLMCSWEIVYE
jgi:hypothetical protein